VKGRSTVPVDKVNFTDLEKRLWFQETEVSRNSRKSANKCSIFFIPIHPTHLTPGYIYRVFHDFRA